MVDISKKNLQKKTRETLGSLISPAIIDIEDILWEFEANTGLKPYFSDEALRAITKIFMAVIMDKMYDLQVSEGMSQEDMEAMATKCGEDLRNFIRIYTGIDSHNMYK